MDHLDAGGGEVLFVPRKTLDANPLQLMFSRFKWVREVPLAMCGVCQCHKPNTLCYSWQTSLKHMVCCIKASMQALKQCPHRLSTPNTDSHNSLWPCSWQKMPPDSSSPWKAPSLTRQIGCCTSRHRKISKRVNFLFPTSEQHEWSIFSLWVKAVAQSRRHHPKEKGRPLGPSRPAPQSCEQHSALQCCLCHAGSGLCPTPKISSEKPETPVCQRNKARGNKLSPLSWAHKTL